MNWLMRFFGFITVPTDIKSNSDTGHQVCNSVVYSKKDTVPSGSKIFPSDYGKSGQVRVSRGHNKPAEWILPDAPGGDLRHD